MAEQTPVASDRPLVNPADDRLNFEPLARHLADAILKTSTQGGVIGIHGPWGSGKTTLVNFVVHFLDKATPHDDGETPASTRNRLDKPIIVRFNPWWFSGQEDLALRMLDQLRAELKKRGASRRVTKSLATFSESLATSPFATLQKAGFVGRLFFRKPTDVVALRDRIVKALGKDQRRYVFVIDDVDRLTSEELRQLFAVVKAIADFPRTTYLIACDRDVVAAALADDHGTSGYEYLEKIVQVPFELPSPDQTALRQLLFERLDAIVVDPTPSEVWDQDRWGEVFLGGVDAFIRTPRNVTQLSNALALTYPAVAGEVNPADFIAIETLRINSSAAYQVVRQSPDEFAGSISSSIVGGTDPGSEIQAFHQGWLTDATIEEAPKVKTLLRALFPKVDFAFGGYRPGEGLEPGWRRQLRVCSPERFPVYFQLATPPGTVSAAEVRATLALASDESLLTERLTRLTANGPVEGARPIRSLLESLVDYADAGIGEDQARGLLVALFDVGDDLVRSEPSQPRGLFDFGMDIVIGRIIYRILRHLAASDRLPLVREAMTNGRAISTIVHEVSTMGQAHGKYGSNRVNPDALISEEELGELEALARDRIRAAAAEGSLKDAPRLPSILYRWLDWAPPDEVKAWVSGFIESDDGLAQFLERFLSESISYSTSPPRASVHTYMDPSVLEPFVDPASLEDRAQKVADDAAFTDRERLAATTFVKGLRLRREGKDPTGFRGGFDDDAIS